MNKIYYIIIIILLIIPSNLHAISKPIVSLSKLGSGIKVSLKVKNKSDRIGSKLILYKKINSRRFKKIAEYSSLKKSQSYSDTNVEDGQTLRYRAKLVPSTGASAMSNMAVLVYTEPVSSSGNFDSQGNVTDIGRELFAIPDSLNANISIGRTIHQQNCSGCHSEKLSRSYLTLVNILPLSPMYITNLSNQEIADLAAYLNRFRQ